MTILKLAEAEAVFADIIWDNEPIRSGELIKRAEKELNWKSTTSYTVLKRLCNRGIFQNKNATVTSLISREDFDSAKSQQFVDKAFEGSLPKFLASFIGGKKLDAAQAAELKAMIDQHVEDRHD